jgi:2-hydroxychromene-2-carboxylate isomerase
MTRIDYYVSLNSPWTHLGAARIEAIAARHGAQLRVHPVDLGKVVFPASGGVPVPQRSPQRQAYRLQELRRWRDHLSIPIQLSPAFFPHDETLSAQAVIAVRELVGDAPAVALAHRVLKAVWEENRNCADREVLAALVAEIGLAPTLLDEAAREEWARLRRADAEAALARGVFGAPSYVIGDEIFWGQDRLEFVARYLARGE